MARDNGYQGRGKGRGNGKNRGRGFNKKRGGFNRNNDERVNEKGLTFKYQEPKTLKEFKISLGGSNNEKVNLPIFCDESQYEVIFI